MHYLNMYINIKKDSINFLIFWVGILIDLVLVKVLLR